MPEGTQILHSGTKLSASGQLVVNGGRVLGAVAYGATLEEAVKRAYALAEKIHFEGMHFRHDIAARQLQRGTNSIKN
jgi:phosphoribosylamine--glycine ligase